jgi:hypothetical protein
MNIGEDSVLTTHRVDCKLSSFTDELHIHLLGDIHHDSPNCDITAYKRDVADIRRQHDAGIPYRIILMGDYTDRCSSSERSKLSHAKVHESTMATWDRDALRDVTKFLDSIWFAKDNIIGAVQGNHYWRFMTGDLTGRSSDAYMADKLGCKWLGFLSYLRIGVAVGNMRTAIDGVVSHGGRGGGKLAGTSINQVDDMRRIFPGASFYAQGHNHQAGAVPAAALFAFQHKGNSNKEGLDLRERKQLLLRTGSYLKAYEQDTPSYPVQAMYKPATLGHAELIVKLTNARVKGGNGARILTHDIKAVV